MLKKKRFAIPLFVILSLLVIMIITNIICFYRDQNKLDNAYGRRVEVAGAQMVAEIYGEDNEDTIVILPGLGSPSPVLEFKPLAVRLSEKYRVITLEPFGYGLSDGTDAERTVENIVEELHECVTNLGVSEYCLMGHSISGIYALYWANTFTDEVTGFIGLDPSVPGQLDSTPGAVTFTKLSGRLSQLLYYSGIMRMISLINPESVTVNYQDTTHTEADIEILRMLATDSMSSSEAFGEMKNIGNNFNTVRDMTFPDDISVLMFLSQDNCDQLGDWVPLHENVVANTPDSEIIILDGGHYVHLAHPDTICDTILNR